MILTPIGNLISWAAQISILVSVGAIFPRILRIQHPRSHLIYYYVLLAIGLTRSLIKPLQHPTVPDLLTVEIPEQFQQAAAGVSPSQPPLLTVRRVIFGIIVLGIVSRLAWLQIGLVHLRFHRKSAHVLTEDREAIRSARWLVHQSAPIYLSNTDIGPITFDAFRPLVLLPLSFFEPVGESQLSILCHEQVHVQSGDWLITLCEQSLQALLWFHPASWWLLSQTKLAVRSWSMPKLSDSGSEDVDIASLLSMSGTTERCARPAISRETTFESTSQSARPRR